MALRKCAYDAPLTVATHREKSRQRILSEISGESIMLELPIELDVRYVKDAFECRTAKLDPERMPHETVRAVTADDIVGLKGLVFAGVVFDLSRDVSIASCFPCSTINRKGYGLSPHPYSSRSIRPRMSPPSTRRTLFPIHPRATR